MIIYITITSIIGVLILLLSIIFKLYIGITVGLLFIALTFFLGHINTRILECKLCMSRLTESFLNSQIDEAVYDECRIKLINNLTRIEYFFYTRLLHN